jgi:hypothetical protein
MCFVGLGISTLEFRQCLIGIRIKIVTSSKGYTCVLLQLT